MSSKVNQQDYSVQTAAEANNILGYGSALTIANPYSVIAQPNSNIEGVTFNEFPQTVADAVSSLVGAVKESVTQSAQSSQQAVTTLGNKLESLSQGDTAILPKIVLYIVIGGAILAIGRKFL